uniref:Uncharacterized protein n=1 Tax=viral metagenome TaxID=1070528 RepID=A0A6C0HHB3_9ZZZZ
MNTTTELPYFNSIYIPNLPDDLMLLGKNISNADGLTRLFGYQLPLGRVKRVDIATRPHHSGAHVKCAFVHFEYWFSGSENMRIQLAKHDVGVRLYGPHQYANFYSSTNSSFERFITLKINKAPIEEVPELEADKMNIHQLVDNYKRLETKLAEKDAMLTKLEHLLLESRATVEFLNNENNELNRMYSANREHLVDMEFELIAARCAAGDVGEPNDGGPMTLDELETCYSPSDGPMTLDELEAQSPRDGGPMTLDELETCSSPRDGPMTIDELDTSESKEETQLVRLTPGNVSQYIGYEIMFKSRGKNVVSRIISVSSGLKTIKIDYPDLQNNLEIVSRKIYVVV